jgi:hypothetical protein
MGKATPYPKIPVVDVQGVANGFVRLKRFVELV